MDVLPFVTNPEAANRSKYIPEFARNAGQMIRLAGMHMSALTQVTRLRPSDESNNSEIFYLSRKAG